MFKNLPFYSCWNNFKYKKCNKYTYYPLINIHIIGERLVIFPFPQNKAKVFSSIQPYNSFLISFSSIFFLNQGYNSLWTIFYTLNTAQKLFSWLWSEVLDIVCKYSMHNSKCLNSFKNLWSVWNWSIWQDHYGYNCINNNKKLEFTNVLNVFLLFCLTWGYTCMNVKSYYEGIWHQVEMRKVLAKSNST